jgi:hypothetical protein
MDDAIDFVSAFDPLGFPANPLTGMNLDAGLLGLLVPEQLLRPAFTTCARSVCAAKAMTAGIESARARVTAIGAQRRPLRSRSALA